MIALTYTALVAGLVLGVGLIAEGMIAEIRCDPETQDEPELPLLRGGS